MVGVSIAKMMRTGRECGNDGRQLEADRALSLADRLDVGKMAVDQIEGKWPPVQVEREVPSHDFGVGTSFLG